MNVPTWKTSKKGIAPKDWDNLMEVLKKKLPPDKFKIVQNILEAMCTYYI